MDALAIVDTAKKKAGCATDSALAERLGVTKQAVSNWRHGTSLPDIETCGKLAFLSDIPLNKVIGIMGEQRAISAGEKRVWRTLAAALFVSLVIVPTAAMAAHFPTNGHAERSQVVGIMRTMRKLFAGVRRLWHAIGEPNHAHETALLA